MWGYRWYTSTTFHYSKFGRHRVMHSCRDFARDLFHLNTMYGARVSNLIVRDAMIFVIGEVVVAGFIVGCQNGTICLAVKNNNMHYDCAKYLIIEFIMGMCINNMLRFTGFNTIQLYSCTTRHYCICIICFLFVPRQAIKLPFAHICRILLFWKKSMDTLY